MDDRNPGYLIQNRPIAERLMFLLEDRRLLRDRSVAEDQNYCRMSADTLRGALGIEMTNVRGGGFLLEAIRDLRRACTVFVSAAGPEARLFRTDDTLFRERLDALREIFAHRVDRIVNEFELVPTPEIQQIIDFAR